MAPIPDVVVLKINIPYLKLQKAIRVNSADLVWNLKRQVEEKVAAEIKEVLNYGIFVHGKDGKKGKYLDERNTVASYHLDGSSKIDFQLKSRVGAEPMDLKKQKRFMEDIQKGLLEKVKEKTTKTTDFNFCLDGETPISAAVMNNDNHMMMWLMDNGAFLDYRVGDKDQWKTPLHLAALHNKTIALKTLIQFGAWIDSKDTLGLTPLYYAGTGGNTECVLRLLLAKADTEILDEHGRSVLHQAALNNFDCIVALLIDFGANIHAVNVGGNTPLHVAASRNSKEATKWLLNRGADVTKVNKSGKKPLDMAIQANCTEVCAVLNSFKPESATLPPPRYTPESSSEYDGIVQSVLSALSSSIGKEYTPALHYTKAPVASVRVKSTMPLRKTIIQERDSSPLGNSPAISASPLSGISGSSSTSGSAKRESFRAPPPPDNRTSMMPESSTPSSVNILGPEGANMSNVGSETSMNTPSSLRHRSGQSHHSSQSASKSGDNLSVKFAVEVEEKVEAAPILVPGTIEEKFEEAWKKVGAMQDTPRMMLKLKAYLSDKAKAKEGPELEELLGGLEQVEAGVCIAADEMANLRKENERLLAQLNKYVQI